MTWLCLGLSTATLAGMGCQVRWRCAQRGPASVQPLSEQTSPSNWAGIALPILTFHALECGREAICFSPQVFRRALDRLQAAGYRSLGLPQVVERLRQDSPLPERSLVITFDDGYQSVYDAAFPMLQSYGFTATVFLTVGTEEKQRSSQRLPSLGGRTMLSWSEIREMHRAGLAFGAHTLTHPDLTNLPADRVEAEACVSRAVIEDALGAKVACFAYPYGRYHKQSREIVKRHYACACSDRLGLVTSRSDPYALERVDAYYLRTDRLFGLMLSRPFPWYLRARSIPRRLRRAFLGNPT